MLGERAFDALCIFAFLWSSKKKKHDGDFVWSDRDRTRVSRDGARTQFIMSGEERRISDEHKDRTAVATRKWAKRFDFKKNRRSD